MMLSKTYILADDVHVECVQIYECVCTLKRLVNLDMESSDKC